MAFQRMHYFPGHSSNFNCTCLSSDTKPTDAGIPIGTVVLETDTNSRYYFNGATWTLFSLSGGGAGDASAANQSLEIAALNKINAQILDYDTGAGTANTVVLGMALPGSGGPVAGGTTSNPVNVALPAATVSTLTPLTTVGLNAGSQIVGKVGIDQTTPGTTNLVALAANQSVNVAQVGGTNTVTGGVAGTQAVGGSVATNVAIGTNPVNMGGQGVSSENSAVTAGRMVQAVFDLVGKQIVLPYANPENFVSGAITSAMTGTTSTSLIAAPAAGLRNYITQITVSNASTSVPTDILIQDGSGGTTLYVIPAPAGTGTGSGAAGGTYVFPTPLRQPTTATAIFCANVTTGSSTKVSASGYKGA